MKAFVAKCAHHPIVNHGEHVACCAYYAVSCFEHTDAAALSLAVTLFAITAIIAIADAMHVL